MILHAIRIPPQRTDAYAQAGLTRKRGGQVVARLEAAGMVVCHSFSTGKRGGSLKLLEITARGWEELKRHGIASLQRPKSMTWEHQLGVDVTEAIGRQEQRQVDREVQIESMRLDVRWRSVTGAAVFFQVGISSPEREVDNACKALKLPAIAQAKLVLICRDKAFADRVRRLMAERDPGGVAAARIRIRLLGQVLDTYYNLKRGGHGHDDDEA
jgi:hypothetical protein